MSTLADLVRAHTALADEDVDRLHRLVAEWQLGKVQRVALSRTGSTYTGSVRPFLLGLKDPLPVLATAGGGLLVGDWKTGTIYEIARPGSGPR